LPAAAAADAASAPSLRVTLNAKGEAFLLEHRVDTNGLRENLEREARANPAVRVTLAADQSLSYREIVALLDLIKKAGVSRVALAAQP
jgi:biopolymer transport protein ExbD